MKQLFERFKKYLIRRWGLERVVFVEKPPLPIVVLTSRFVADGEEMRRWPTNVEPYVYRRLYADLARQAAPFATVTRFDPGPENPFSVEFVAKLEVVDRGAQ